MLYGRVDDCGKFKNISAEEKMEALKESFSKGPDVFKRLFKESDDSKRQECELDEKIKWFVKLKSHGLIDES